VENQDNLQLMPVCRVKLTCSDVLSGCS